MRTGPLNVPVPGLIVLAALALIAFGSCVQASSQEGSDEYVPTLYGMALAAAKGYDPSDAHDFLMFSIFALFDYDRIWPHPAPEALRFKVEAGLGVTLRSQPQVVASAGVMALYFLDPLRAATFRPYVEAGVGVIYMGHRVEGQSSRFNFNPQLGIGTELWPDSTNPAFFALRLHHVSNAGLTSENRGTNSLLFMIGRYY
jgi:lipid A 3-O-deacylase